MNNQDKIYTSEKTILEILQKELKKDDHLESLKNFLTEYEKDPQYKDFFCNALNELANQINETPELKSYYIFYDDILQLATKYNPAIINLIDGFVDKIKNQNDNDFFKCEVFKQLLPGGNVEPLKIPKGTLSYIGAMTHRGKTTALISIAVDALLQDKKVYFVTTEETPDQLIARFIKAFIIAKVVDDDQQKLIKCFIKNNLDKVIEQYFKKQYPQEPVKDSPGIAVYRAVQKLETLFEKGKLIIIDHTKQRTFDELKTLLYTIVDSGSVILLDYMQHLKMPLNIPINTRQAIIQGQSQTLADYAGHKDLIIIAGAQFNRQGQTIGKPYEPDLLDLTLFRESGDIEQDAHLVIGIGKQEQPQNDGTDAVRVRRFYKILKQRGKPYDNNQYEINDLSQFSFYEVMKEPENTNKLQLFTPTPSEKKASKKTETGENNNIHKTNYSDYI